MAQSKKSAADAFNAMTKEEKDAKIAEIVACLRSKAYKLKTNDSAKKSEAYDSIQFIIDKDGNEIHCFYYCLPCQEASKNPIIFADTSNGTSKILTHSRSHKRQAQAKEQKPDVGNTSAVTVPAPKKEVVHATSSSSSSYVFDADALALTLSKMTSIGHAHGVLQPDAVKSLMPKAAAWSLDWVKKADDIAALVNQEFPDEVTPKAKEAKKRPAESPPKKGAKRGREHSISPKKSQKKQNTKKAASTAKIAKKSGAPKAKGNVNGNGKRTKTHSTSIAAIEIASSSSTASTVSSSASTAAQIKVSAPKRKAAPGTEGGPTTSTGSVAPRNAKKPKPANDPPHANSNNTPKAKGHKLWHQNAPRAPSPFRSVSTPIAKNLRSRK